MSKPKAGRPAFYKTPEELQAAVDRYFDSCKGTPVFDKRGLPVMIRPGVQKMAGEIPPTLAGLSHFLGYRDRQQFTRQRRRSVEFANVVALARLRVEHYAESRLYDLDGYGKPEDNFANIGLLWGVYLRAAHPDLARVMGVNLISPKDVAVMMALLKVARAATGNSPDTFVDLAGYAACAGEIATRIKTAIAPGAQVSAVNRLADATETDLLRGPHR